MLYSSMSVSNVLASPITLIRTVFMLYVLACLFLGAEAYGGKDG